MTGPGFAELAAATNFSFLTGAAHPGEMIDRALALGLSGLGIADRNTVAGVVRAWAALNAAREQGRASHFRLVTGARLVFADGTPDIIAYPMDRRGWGRLTRLLSIGNLRTEKGGCLLHLADLLEYAKGLLLIVMAPARRREEAMLPALLASLRATGQPLFLGVAMHRNGPDRRRLARWQELADAAGVRLLATNDALFAIPAQKVLHDILACIRDKVTIRDAGRMLAPHAERHLKPPEEIARLFADAPDAVAASLDALALIRFDLGELRYEYPHEPIPPGYSPQDWLAELVRQHADRRWPAAVPADMQQLLDEELKVIGRLGYAAYFLTVHDIVAFAQGRGILCQGRGSAANSAVCFVLGITAVDPARHRLLFSRFMSEERKEPPDIDVDFEHERREEVMQYIYQRYSRDRAGIVATVIHYRPRSTVREVGKALGMSEDVTARLAGTVWGSHGAAFRPGEDQDGHSRSDTYLVQAGFDPANPEIARLVSLVGRLLHFPRHLSQHVGGFVLTEDRLDETVPIHHGAMEGRTFIEWDKDDIDALGLMKVDILALGMLSCIRKAFEMIAALPAPAGALLRLDTIPDADEAVFDMLCRGDSIGVFQIESRAQINMLPRLRPRNFYDLAIQVAIVRPGPIQGDMVHPYLRRRQGREPVEFPSPAPPHDPNELREVLGKTLGVPLFQEQAMKLAIAAAGFTPSESNQLRRAMATFRNLGQIQHFRDKLVGGMVARGYQAEFAQRCFQQIEGFGSYGFPESHAIAFARLVWVSSWLKYHYPAIFAAALLNAQPMGFYAPAQIVRDAREHRVAVHPVDVNASDWDNKLEGGTMGLRLGFRQIDGFRRIWAEAIMAARPFASIEQLARDARLPSRALRLLADADAMRSLGTDRRAALWEVRRTPPDELPLFAAARARELGEEPDAHLPAMALPEQVVADYQTVRLSLKAHPLQFLRARLEEEGIASAAAIAGMRNGKLVRTAGVVLVRQRPGNGKAIFVTLEDETGVVNIIMWARTFERDRRAVMAARLMEVIGEVQKSPEGIIHVLAHRLIDRTSLLHGLSETHGNAPPLRASHPRDVRVLPPSRDFH
jgi:error-prone DNA polymerase